MDADGDVVGRWYVVRLSLEEKLQKFQAIAIRASMLPHNVEVYEEDVDGDVKAESTFLD